jgi:hypothetical protein
MLLAGLAAAVPLILHLLQRSEGRTVKFPALRYLQRMAREHARSIRTRQLLLMLLRISAILLLALAAARPLLTLLGSGHPPTALVLVVDNSMSSGAVDGDRRVLDGLLEAGARSLERARDGDRIWILRGAEPWLPARPLTPEEARTELAAVAAAPGTAALASVLASALGIAGAAGMEAAEVHLLYDGQGSATDLIEAVEVPPGVTLLAFRPDGGPPLNRWLTGVLVGGGIPPLPGEPTEVSVELGASFPAPPSDAADPEGPARATGNGPVDVRLTAQDRLRARASIEPGATGLLRMGPFGEGWVQGFLETEPDGLRADDRAFFALRIREPVPVRAVGDPGPFVGQAVDVLTEAGRVRVGSGARMVVLGSGASVPGTVESAIVIPPSDPSLLPATNRVLARLGTRWRLAPPSGAGITGLEPSAAVDLTGVEVTSAYRLEGAPDGGSDRVLVRTQDGRPWLIDAVGEDARVLILASPVDPAWTSLPVSPRMVPFLDWALTRWAAGGGAGSAEVRPGQLVPISAEALRVVGPDGTSAEVGRERSFRPLSGPGIYRVEAADSLLALVAVNPWPEESDLARRNPAEGSLLATGLHALTGSPGEWDRRIFRVRTGPEGGGFLLVAALLLLLLEGAVAAAGVEASRRSPAPGTPSAP